MRVICIRKGPLPERHAPLHLRSAANASGRQIPFVLGIPIVPPRWDRCGSKCWTKNPRLNEKRRKNVRQFENFFGQIEIELIQYNILGHVTIPLNQCISFVLVFSRLSGLMVWFECVTSYLHLSNRVVGGCRMFGAWICLTLSGSAHEHLVT